MADGTYTVQPGDTLSAIAARNHTTVAQIQQLNGISDPNRLSVGEKLKLAQSHPASSAVTCSVRPLFLDPMRYPIEGVNYRIQCGPNTVTGTSEANGLGKTVTAKPGDRASIWAQIPWKNNAWEQLADISVEIGEKLVTLISPMTRVKAPLDPHPKDKFGQPKQESAPKKTAISHPRGTPSTGKGKTQSEVAKGSGKGVHSRKEKDNHGITRVVLTQDLPDLKDCFAAYTGEKITEDDWKRAAANIGCEIPVLKSIPAVETSGLSGFYSDTGTPPIPRLRFERTWFHNKTNGKYDATNADLSMPPHDTLGALKHSKNKSANDEYARLEAAPMYPGTDPHGTGNFHRFINACLLDQSAAIECCSWGKFQVMGFNWRACGSPDIHTFLKAIFTSEKAQFDMYTGFVQNDEHGALKQAVVNKDWVRIAKIYNGAKEAVPPKWWLKHHTANSWVPYHVKLKEAYERIKAKA